MMSSSTRGSFTFFLLMGGLCSGFPLMSSSSPVSALALSWMACMRWALFLRLFRCFTSVSMFPVTSPRTGRMAAHSYRPRGGFDIAATPAGGYYTHALSHLTHGHIAYTKNNKYLQPTYTQRQSIEHHKMSPRHMRVQRTAAELVNARRCRVVFYFSASVTQLPCGFYKTMFSNINNH